MRSAAPPRSSPRRCTATRRSGCPMLLSTSIPTHPPPWTASPKRSPPFANWTHSATANVDAHRQCPTRGSPPGKTGGPSKGDEDAATVPPAGPLGKTGGPSKGDEDTATVPSGGPPEENRRALETSRGHRHRPCCG